MRTKWKFKNIRQLEKSFQNQIKHYETVGEEGIQEAAELLLQLSQPLVPIDTGALQASGSIVPDGKTVRYVTYEARSEEGYDYAPIQHEVLDFHHEIGQAKYLEQPFKENMEVFLEIIAKRARS